MMKFIKKLENDAVKIKWNQSGKTFISKVFRAVANGVPLPEEHGDLIDISNLLTVTEYDGENEKVYVPYNEIENVKPIIEANKKESEK